MATTMLANKQALHASAMRSAPKRVSRRTLPIRAATAPAAEEVPSPEKRSIMNLVLAGGAALPVSVMAYPFLAFFVPPR